MATLLLLLLVFTVVLTSTAAQTVNADLKMLMIDTAVGPESLAFDSRGEGPYTGVSDGRVIKWGGHNSGWQSFAFPSQWSEDLCDGEEIHMEEKCGRPLGLQFNKKTGELYIADAYFGLMVVSPDGGWARQLATEAGGVPFKFTNGVDVDQETGVVYFTDSSARFQRWENEVVVATGDSTGRFMKYDPETQQVTVLVSGLAFPNGVAISHDRSFVVVAGTTNCLISRYWLQGPKGGQFEPFAELPGYPDNIKRNADGEFWVAINREKIKLGGDVVMASTAAVKLSNEGKILKVLDGTVMSPLSEVEERNGTLWLGSVLLPYVGVYGN
ncbi:hypothetical protein M5K25_015626 [Dendrobium thyrsiflorum]|uniref:Strictosidine synthase conserved region domain-containing protein n=1 Tax=Dendrobium thyrsiflorum TaxID=117978 RepID=A0ABD0URC5_DENTH